MGSCWWRVNSVCVSVVVLLPAVGPFRAGSAFPQKKKSKERKAPKEFSCSAHWLWTHLNQTAPPPPPYLIVSPGTVTKLPKWKPRNPIRPLWPLQADVKASKNDSVIWFRVFLLEDLSEMDVWKQMCEIAIWSAASVGFLVLIQSNESLVMLHVINPSRIQFQRGWNAMPPHLMRATPTLPVFFSVFMNTEMWNDPCRPDEVRAFPSACDWCPTEPLINHPSVSPYAPGSQHSAAYHNSTTWLIN